MGRSGSVSGSGGLAWSPGVSPLRGPFGVGCRRVSRRGRLPSASLLAASPLPLARRCLRSVCLGLMPLRPFGGAAPPSLLPGRGLPPAALRWFGLRLPRGLRPLALPRGLLRLGWVLAGASRLLLVSCPPRRLARARLPCFGQGRPGLLRSAFCPAWRACPAWVPLALAGFSSWAHGVLCGLRCCSPCLGPLPLWRRLGRARALTLPVALGGHGGPESWSRGLRTLVARLLPCTTCATHALVAAPLGGAARARVGVGPVSRGSVTF